MIHRLYDEAVTGSINDADIGQAEIRYDELILELEQNMQINMPKLNQIYDSFILSTDGKSRKERRYAYIKLKRVNDAIKLSMKYLEELDNEIFDL